MVDSGFGRFGGRPEDRIAFNSPVGMDFEQRKQKVTSWSVFSNVTKTTDYNAGGEAVILVDASGGMVYIYLPKSELSKNKTYYIKKIDDSANAVAIVPTGTSMIDGYAGTSITTPYMCLTIVCDGTDWWII